MNLERSVGWRVTSVLLGMAFVLAAGAAVAVEEEIGAEPPAIPPGQEELLQEMLGKGAELPGACKLADGHVEYTVIEATYDCRHGKVVVELAHASWAVASDVQTRQFALGVTEGSAPPSLVDTLAGRILAREDDFEWSTPAEDGGAVEGPAAE